MQQCQVVLGFVRVKWNTMFYDRYLSSTVKLKIKQRHGLESIQNEKVNDLSYCGQLTDGADSLCLSISNPDIPNLYLCLNFLGWQFIFAS